MKPFFLLSCFILCVFSATCFAQSIQQHNRLLPVLDKTKSYPPKKIEFDIVVTYVPLETSHGVLLDGACRLRYISNEKFVLSDEIRGDVFIFNKDGKILSSFNQKGGLGYSFLTFLAYDEKRNKLFILDHITKKIFVYSENGTLLCSFKTPQNTHIVEIYNFDDNTLLAFDEDINGSDQPTKPYVYIAKNDGKIIDHVNIEVGKVNPTRMEGVGKDGASSLWITHYGIPDNCKFGNDFILANKSMDTVYILKQNKMLIPLFTQTPSVHSEHPTAASVGMMSNRFLKICVASYDLEESKKAYEKGVRWRPKFRFFVLDMNLGEFFEDSDRGNFTVHKVDIPKNQSVELMQAINLVNSYKSGRLKNGLKKEVSSKLDIGDNPVIEIKKFK